MMHVHTSVILESWIRIFKYFFDYSIIEQLFRIFDCSIIRFLPPQWNALTHTLIAINLSKGLWRVAARARVRYSPKGETADFRTPGLQGTSRDSTRLKSAVSPWKSSKFDNSMGSRGEWSPVESFGIPRSPEIRCFPLVFSSFFYSVLQFIMYLAI